MKIVIGTLAAPKIAAIQEAITKTPYFATQEVEIQPVQVSSGISEMPISLEETMQGAKNRAENAKKQIEHADFYIGME
jgi:non-canonical (house-cleaning) NTP pyrophosphatase